MGAFLSLLLVAAAGTNGGHVDVVAMRTVTAHTAKASKVELATYVHVTIPAWARKYNMNCSGCHYPAPPRLNATGQQFKWAGYRMPDDIDEQVDVTQLSNYLSAGGQMLFDYARVEDPAGTTTTATFAAPSAVVFYAGPLGKHFSAFVELDHGFDGTAERIFHVSGIWGKDGNFGGFRAGQMHNLLEWGVAGFDRLPGLNELTTWGPITRSVPFALGDPQVGLEAYYVLGRNRLSAQVLNGIKPSGEVATTDVDNRKDFLITDQLLLDNAGSGAQIVGYYGTITQFDTTGAVPYTHFWRLGATASKIVSNFELLGGVIYGRDEDLPAYYPTVKNTGLAYWVSGQYFVKSTELSLFARYEVVDPDTDVPDDAARRMAVGFVLPLTLPQYLRWAVEYRLDFPQGGAPKSHDITTGLTLTF